MQEIQSYVTAICFAAIFSAVVQMLSPSEKFKGIISLVLGIFILYTLLSPLKKFKDFSFSDFQESFEYTSEAEKYREKALLELKSLEKRAANEGS